MLTMYWFAATVVSIVAMYYFWGRKRLTKK